MANVITGTTKIFFMMAHPIDHVRSPEVFNPIFAARRIDAIMIPLHVHPHDFSAVWAALRKMRNLGGFIVSVPLKEAAFQLADTADYSAATVRAANAVRREDDGRLVCANFDGPGFMAGLLRNGADAEGRDVLLIGAGGAGAAIAFSLARAAAASIRIADIDADRAVRLAAAVREQFGRITITAGRPDPTGCNLVVNATPCGLHPETDPLPLDVTQLTPDMLVADIVMKPVTTPLLAAAQRAGCDVRFGAGMLDSQAELIMTFFGY
jgi:shikimate dehydrogenase